jgi:hypothetical protein
MIFHKHNRIPGALYGTLIEGKLTVDENHVLFATANFPSHQQPHPTNIKTAIEILKEHNIPDNDIYQVPGNYITPTGKLLLAVVPLETATLIKLTHNIQTSCHPFPNT